MKKYNKYIILSPHSDDAAFSLGASIADNIFKNIQIHTLFSESTCTANNQNKDITQVTRIRKEEDELFFSTCKSKVKLYYFDLLDAPLRLNIKEEEVCSNQNTTMDERLINKIEQTLLNLLTEDSILLSPLGLGNHVDHLLVREMALKLIKNNINVGFYEDLPYAGTISHLEIYHNINQLNNEYNLHLKPLILDSNITIDDKVKACSIYSSQIDCSTINNIRKHHSQFDNSSASERIWML